MTRRRELALAVALDLLVGEPPASTHPVVWMGRLLDRLERRLPAPSAPHAVAGGALAWGCGLTVTAVSATAVGRLPWPVRGVALWTLFSGRLLLVEVAAVERTLRDQGLEPARSRLSRLVSRPTGQLSAAEVRMAAVETLAENLSDSVVAPLLWWRIAGLPGAAAYRWVNTADARWGYRTPAWTRRGRVAARADDVVNVLPSRLTGLAWRARPDRRLPTEAARTPSPNAGWPMAAAALAADVRLVKPDVYVLHASGRDPDATTVPAALRRGATVGLVVAFLTWWSLPRRAR